MKQPKLREAEIFAVPPEDWTPEHLATLKEAMLKRITIPREARKLKSVADTLAEEEAAKKKPTKRKKKSLAEEIGLESEGTKKADATSAKAAK